MPLVTLLASAKRTAVATSPVTTTAVGAIVTVNCLGAGPASGHSCVIALETSADGVQWHTVAFFNRHSAGPGSSKITLRSMGRIRARVTPNSTSTDQVTAEVP